MAGRSGRAAGSRVCKPAEQVERGETNETSLVSARVREKPGDPQFYRQDCIPKHTGKPCLQFLERQGSCQGYLAQMPVDRVHSR